MDAIDECKSNVRKAAETFGLPALSRESGVPYTTVKSYADRDWSHKGLDVFSALARASGRMLGVDQ